MAPNINGTWTWESVIPRLALWRRWRLDLEQHMKTGINDAVMCPFCGECALQFEARHKSPHFKWLELDTDCEADIEQLSAVAQNPHNRSWVRTRRAPFQTGQRSHGGRRLLSVQTCSDCHQSKATRSSFDTGCPPDFLQCILNVPFEQMASLSLLTPVMSFSAAAARGRYVSGAQACMCCCRLLSLVWLPHLCRLLPHGYLSMLHVQALNQSLQQAFLASCANVQEAFWVQ